MEAGVLLPVVTSAPAELAARTDRMEGAMEKLFLGPSVFSIDGRPQVILNVAGIKMHALVDTGASRMLMDLKFFRKVCLSSRRSTFLKNITGPLASVKSLNVQGETNLNLSNDMVARVVVVATLPYMHNLLLGTDLLRQYQGTIDYARQLVHLNARSFSFVNFCCEQADLIGDTHLTTGDALIVRVIHQHARVLYREGDPLVLAKNIAPMRIVTEGHPLA